MAAVLREKLAAIRIKYDLTWHISGRLRQLNGGDSQV